jgi:DNA-binding response OmpR family regulator
MFDVIDRSPLVGSRLAQRSEVALEPKRRVAVLENSGPDREFVCNVVRSLGHVATEFANTEDLVGAMLSGSKFSGVLASFSGDQHAALSGLRILRHATAVSTPMLLMLRAEQLLQANAFVLDPAADFVMVPCEECELIVRITASMKATGVLAKAERLTFGRYRFDPPSRMVTFDGCRVRLKPLEFDLALFLFRNAGVAKSREAIFDAVWSRREHEVDTRTIDVHIANIRKKLKLNLENGSKLSSVYGLGYLLFLSGD